MDDVVDAVLDDDIRSSSNIHFDRKAGGTLQTIGLVGDAVVLTEDARTADGTTYDGGIGAKGQLSHIVGPRLGGDRVAIADHRTTVCRRQYVDGVQEVEPVGVARQVQGQFVCFRKVAIRIVALRQRTGDERSAVHLRKVCQIDADLDGVATTDVIADGIALRLLAWHQRHTAIATKGDGCMTYEHLREGDRFGACQI